MIDHDIALSICAAYGVTLNTEYETMLCRMANAQTLWIVPRESGKYILITDI